MYLDFTKPIRNKRTLSPLTYVQRLAGRKVADILVIFKNGSGMEVPLIYDESELENIPVQRWRNIYEKSEPRANHWHDTMQDAKDACHRAQLRGSELIVIQQDNGDGTFSWLPPSFYNEVK